MKEKKNNKKEVKKTYIINLDGMKADYFGSMGHQGCLTPTFVSLAELGIRFTNCKAIMPANTGTNHTAIMTGAHAGSHGILGAVGHYKKLDFNHPRLSKRYGSPKGGLYAHRHLQVPTFFNIIKANNPDLVTAFIPGKTWLGNIIADEDCDITIYPGNTSENCDEHKPNPSYVTPPEGYVLGGPAHPEDNEIIPRLYIPKKGEIQQEPPGTFSIGALKATADPLPSDKWLIDQAIKCVDHDDPDFMYMILMNIDAAGHGYGASLTEKELGENELDQLYKSKIYSQIIFPHLLNTSDASPTGGAILSEQEANLPICGAGSSMVCISAYGDVIPCVALPITAGNIREKSLIEIWKTSSVLKKVRSFTFDKFTECLTCDKINICFRCPGIFYSDSGSAIKPSRAICRIATYSKKVMKGGESIDGKIVHRTENPIKD